MSEISLKLQRVRQFLAKRKFSAALLGNQNNFSWITGGKNAHVVLASEAAIAGILVTSSRAHVLTNAIEHPRLYAEEITPARFQPLVHPWYEADSAKKLIKKVVGKGIVVSDNGAYGTRNMGGILARLRWQLLPEEIKRYREVGAAAIQCLETVCRKIKPGTTEYEIASELGGLILSKGALPHVILVATDERIIHFRHPIPQSKKLRRHAMLVVCVKKYGLIANATRLVHFGKLPRELRGKHDAVCRVDTAFNMSTRVGYPVSMIFRAGMHAYAQEGFVNEWKLHHQGGATGYAGREWFGSPGCKEVVLENQAFAWNPSITGTKCEDTVLVRKDGLEILTPSSNRWPMVHVHHADGCIERPDILVR